MSTLILIERLEGVAPEVNLREHLFVLVYIKYYEWSHERGQSHDRSYERGHCDQYTLLALVCQSDRGPVTVLDRLGVKPLGQSESSRKSYEGRSTTDFRATGNLCPRRARLLTG